MAVLRSGLALAFVMLSSPAAADVDVQEPDIAVDSDTAAKELTFTEEVKPAAAAPLEIDLRPTPDVQLGYAGGYNDYDEAKPPIWLPFGLLDRMRRAPFHMSATTELGSHDAGDGTASLTLHAQMSPGCGCNIGIYATLPASIAMTDESRNTQALAAGGPIASPMSQPRTQLGTLDVGLFSGTKAKGRTSWIYRVGSLLPTGSREPHPWLPSARAGDRVLELPRSAGVRLSTSKIYGWKSFFGLCFDSAFRIDAGVDVASVLALPGNPVHVVPRAGVGMMATWHGNWVYGADAVISADPFVDDRTNLRFGAGLTARYARPDGRRSVIQPAVTLATVRTHDGWSASLLLDLTASMSPKD